jgi:hypothetical protein
LFVALQPPVPGAVIRPGLAIAAGGRLAAFKALKKERNPAGRSRYREIGIDATHSTSNL